MKLLCSTRPITAISSFNSISCTRISNILVLATPSPNFFVSSLPIQVPKKTKQSSAVLRAQSLPDSQSNDLEDDPDAQVEDLRVPDSWLVPSRALEESEWLRVTLHKWLDDEYCPEPTNVEISRVAASSYYYCLVEKQTDLGEILLQMARRLESISYQESFHGAFSSANAAVNLIAQRIEQTQLLN